MKGIKMNEQKSNACAGGPKLIFACSGAADVGEISDLVARKLTADDAGKMFCLAGIGGKVEPILQTTKNASRILAIDGCPLNCVANALQLAGFDKFEHLQLGDIGLQKGKSPATPENVERAASKCDELLNQDKGAPI
jgi:uncharacterized metal-binding protein